MSANSLTFQGDFVKCAIPKELYLAIAKIQIEQQIDWEDACIKGSELLNTGGETFKRRVIAEARKLYDSELMKQVNRTRKTIRDKAFQEGLNQARTSESNFQVPCTKCQRPMYFSSRDTDWEREKSELIRTFSRWHHSNCQ